MTGIRIKFHAFLNDDKELKATSCHVAKGRTRASPDASEVFLGVQKGQKGFNKGEAEEPIFMFMLPNYFRAAENENKTKGDKLRRWRNERRRRASTHVAPCWRMGYWLTKAAETDRRRTIQLANLFRCYRLAGESFLPSLLVGVVWYALETI